MKIKSILLSIFHHTLLYLYARVNQFVVWMDYIHDIQTDQKKAELYQEQVRKWNDIENLDELCEYFQNRKAYKNEGLFHHYNSKEEFFLHGYDCEDVAFMAQKKLRELGYKTQVIGIMGSKVSSWHYDLVVIENHLYNDGIGNLYLEEQFVLFNYGKLIKKKRLKKCIDQLNTYKVNNEYVYPLNKTIWWRCYW
jgi:hypothetical protein